MSDDQEKRNIFPKWANSVPLYILIGLLLFLSFVTFVFWYWFSPKNLEVGYAPKQPIPYSHQLHVSQLGMDCRYCHVNVERSTAATVPATEVCMNCHNIIKKDSPHIAKLAESFKSGKPMQWVKVHVLPDYVYFDHSRHVGAGVSCVSCHGRIDQMKRVHQVEPLSMSWCLDCHRAPEKHLRPKKFVTKLDWKADDQLKMGLLLKAEHHINPGESCSVCHR